MISGMFDSSTLPLLEQVVTFTEARHGVLAGNIANIDTPGYKSRDLSVENFQSRLKEALAAQPAEDVPPSYALNAQLTGQADRNDQSWEKVRETAQDILYHDQHDVNLETQITEIAKNQVQHNLALSIMNAQFRMLRAAVTERV